MPISLPRSLQWEDAFLFLWLGIVEPLLSKLFGSLLGDVQPWDLGSRPNVALGLLFLLASVGGLIVVATRPSGQSESNLFGFNWLTVSCSLLLRESHRGLQ